jgi:serine/threonine protein kinase
LLTLSLSWTAPEAVLKGKFSFASDTYAFGVLIAELFLLGRTPFGSHSNDDIVAAYRKCRGESIPTHVKEQWESVSEHSSLPAELPQLAMECCGRGSSRPTMLAASAIVEDLIATLTGETEFPAPAPHRPVESPLEPGIEDYVAKCSTEAAESDGDDDDALYLILARRERQGVDTEVSLAGNDGGDDYQ